MGRPPGPSASGHSRVALVPPLAALTAAIIAIAGLARRLGEAGAAEAGGRDPVVVPAVSVALLILAGAQLVVHLPVRAPLLMIAARIGAAAVTLLGAAVVAQYVVDWGTGAPRETLFGLDVGWAQRAGPATGLGLALLGASYCALSIPGRRARGFASVSASATLVVALTALVGHAYGAALLYGRNPWGGTAIATAVGLLVLAQGARFTQPVRGSAAIALSAGPGGQLMRRLVPVALGAPFFLGLLSVMARRAELIDSAFGTALVSVLLSLLLVVLIVRQASLLNRVAVEREQFLARERSSHEQVNSILESITDAFFAVDRDWRFTYVNSEAERLLRRSRHELLGKSVWSEFPQAVGAVFQREYERAMAEQRTVHFEAHFPPLGVWFEVHAFPSANGLSVYFHDVTDRKRAEGRLRQSEERYRVLVEMIPQHIWTTTPDGYHTYFSRRWYAFSGTSPEQAMGEGWMDRLHPEDSERMRTRWQHSLRTGEPYSIEYRFRGADGQYHWFLGQAMPQRNEAGELVEWFGTLTDISETKRLEEERESLLANEREARAEAERRREQLERVTESRASLMRGFSHDVKNALNSAKLYAELLERRRGAAELTERQRRMVERIRQSINASVRLIDDVLELARVEAGQLRIERVKTDIGEVTREVVDEFSEQAAAAGLSLKVRVPDVLRAETDPARLRQIVSNLLSNAVKYASPGTVTLRSERRHTRGPDQGEWITVSVEDEGPGIPEEKRETIFEEFTRLDPTATSGAGIGLAISRRIARLLGGDLRVSSEVGSGSTFTLWLPASSLSDATGLEERAAPWDA